MFARMTTMPIKIEKIEEAIKIYRRSVIPAAKRQKGFRGACLLADHASGKGISVTFWRSEKDAAANEENLYYQEQLVKFIEVFAGPPMRDGYEVHVHVMKTPASLKAKKPKKKGKK